MGGGTHMGTGGGEEIFDLRLKALTHLGRPPFRKLYAVVREDLPPGLRAAQMAHAVAGVVQNMPSATLEWQTADNYLIVLGARDEIHLREVVSVLLDENVSHYVWHEPDLGNSLTAVASLPDPTKNILFADLPLAYTKRKRSLWDWIAGKV
jgi:hypothetical protein